MSMQNTLKNISTNIKYYRLKKGFSQQMLAEQAGMSRRMVAALENEQANISLGKLDAIAEALEVRFSQLVQHHSAQQSIVWQENQSVGIFLGARPAQKEAELWVWKLAPQETYCADVDPEGYSEIIYVINGELTLVIEEDIYTIQAGESKAFSSNQFYRFINTTSQPLEFIRNIIY